MATARFMETWAHGLDVADALGVTRPPTARLRHVAHLGIAPWATRFAGPRPATRPTGRSGVELTAPDGDTVDLRAGGRRRPGDRAGAGLLPAGHPAPAPRRPRPGRRPAPVADEWLDVAQAFAGPPGAGRRGPGAAGDGSSAAGVIRIGNASGFYGDRFTAWREMLDGGELDVLTGDYLAELTMLILGRDRLNDPPRATPARSCARWRPASASRSSAA